MNGGGVAERGVLTELARLARQTVYHRVVLDVGPGAESDRRAVGTDHAAEPDARPLGHLDVADDLGIRRDKDVVGEPRRPAAHFTNWHIPPSAPIGEQGAYGLLLPHVLDNFRPRADLDARERLSPAENRCPQLHLLTATVSFQW